MDFRRYGQPQGNVFADMMRTAEPGPMIAQQSQERQSPFSQEEMEAAARSQGFDSYDQMIKYRRLRLPPPRPPQGQAQPSSGGDNILEQLWNDPLGTISGAFEWHPDRTIGDASKKLEEANRRNRR